MQEEKWEGRIIEGADSAAAEVIRERLEDLDDTLVALNARPTTEPRAARSQWIADTKDVRQAAAKLPQEWSLAVSYWKASLVTGGFWSFPAALFSSCIERDPRAFAAQPSLA